MSASFADFLQEHQVDSDELQQAARYYLSERTVDMSTEQMQEILA